MPSFRALPEEDLQALVDYVIYLTIRGEFERRLIGEMGSMNGEPFFEIPEGFDPESADVEVPEELQEQLFATVGEMLVDEIIARWLDRDDNVTEIESPPVPFDYQSDAFKEFAEQGKLLFGGKANCVQCHGVTGLGDGLTGNYDDWTNDWAKTPGVDLTLAETYREFLELGALPPRPIRPRNLHVPMYRGGSTVEDLFLRVKNGIEGTPMPSSPGLTSDEVWAVVAFLKSLPFANQTGH
jgi:cytochrome c5